jgi:hypothetical protein
MIAIRNLLIPALVAAALVMAGCDELATGEKVESVSVSENEAGGYGPVRLTLTPEMSPVAINFRADLGDDPAEIGKWNAYRAALSKDGQEVASGQFNLNRTGTTDAPQGAPYLLHNMLTVRPSEAGDYELVITPTQPVEVRLTATRIDVRRNVRSDDTLR